jgi:4-hydroxy-L-threonine phosphate dehydrogenase PdxA
MLLCDQFRVVNTTLHEPVVAAVQRLSIDLVCRAITATHEAMNKMNFSHPRIAVAGVNPHAGEGGLFGGEDEAIVRPAVAVSAAKGWDVSGPWPADSLFAAREYDAYVVMLHDQGHIPVKLVAPMDSSAISIGTEVIFGSVAHGSAHDIAGKGVADPTAFKNALLRMVKQFGT